MKTSKRIMMIIPNLDFGGAQKSFSNLNIELAKDYTIYVVVFNAGQGIDVPLKGEIIDLGIPAGKGVIFKGLYFIKRVLKIKKLKKKLEINISISFLEGADYVNVLSKVSDKILLSIRGSKRYDENIKGVLGILRKQILIPWLYDKADVIVAVNESIKNEIKNHYKILTRTVVIPNFYDFDVLDQLANELPDKLFQEYMDTSSFNIASVGRLAPEKGYQHIIRLLTVLKPQYSIKLFLIGDGNYLDKLIDICIENELNFTRPNDKKNNASIDVYFLGYIDNPLKYARYVDLFVLPSSAEGFPNAMFEMMSQGVPVAGTDCDGIKELLLVENQKFGAVLPTFGKPAAYRTWEASLKMLIEAPTLRNELGILARVRSRMFRKSLAINKWLELV